MPGGRTRTLRFQPPHKLLAEPRSERSNSDQRNLNGDLGRRAACGRVTEGKEPFSRLLAQPIQQPGSRSSAETVITQVMSQHGENADLCEKQTGQVCKKILLLGGKVSRG